MTTTLDQLREESQQDLKIDQLNIQSEAANNPVLYGKWLDRLAEAKYERIRLDNSLKRTWSERMLYYTGKSAGKVSPVIYDKTEVKSVLQADDDVIRAQSALDLCQLKIQICEETLKAVNGRQFAIKHIIDTRRLESGA